MQLINGAQFLNITCLFVLFIAAVVPVFATVIIICIYVTFMYLTCMYASL